MRIKRQKSRKPKFQSFWITFAQLFSLLGLLCMAILSLTHLQPGTEKVSKRYVSDGMMYFDKATGLPSKGCFKQLRHVLVNEYVSRWSHSWEKLEKNAPRAILRASPFLNDNYTLPASKVKMFIATTYCCFSSGSSITAPPLNARYVRIYKAGNDAIRENMEKLGGKRRVLPRGRGTRIGANDILFTFAREPAERWVAAYHELETRWFEENSINMTDKCPACIFPKFKRGSKDRVWAFLHDLLALQLNSMFEIEHVFPEAGILSRVPRLNFVGRLENFDKDWKALLHDHIQRPSYTWDPSLGKHNSSMDLFNTKKAGLDLLQHDAGFTDILETLLFKDYLCFGYPRRTKSISTD
eukprot:jgi/Picsp_1/383/NSC_00381-R1_hypothetical protein AURANDRAFT_61141 [Aureococcus anophagefferens]